MGIPQLITLEEASARLSVHVCTIRRMIGRGELKAYRLGNKVIRVAEDDIMRYLEKVATQ